jgi:hypothetical protein
MPGRPTLDLSVCRPLRHKTPGVSTVRRPASAACRPFSQTSPRVSTLQEHSGTESTSPSGESTPPEQSAGSVDRQAAVCPESRLADGIAAGFGQTAAVTRVSASQRHTPPGVSTPQGLNFGCVDPSARTCRACRLFSQASRLLSDSRRRVRPHSDSRSSESTSPTATRGTWPARDNSPRVSTVQAQSRPASRLATHKSGGVSTAQAQLAQD